MILSFTGTRHGMSREQQLGLRALLLDIKPTRVHHGGCIGADQQFHDMILQHTQALIVVHPCNLPAAYKFPVTSNHRITILAEKPPLVRNRNLVDTAQATIACPETREEVQRSGTWSTIRYAKRRGAPLIILYPDVGCEGLHATLTKLGV